MTAVPTVVFVRLGNGLAPLAAREGGIVRVVLVNTTLVFDVFGAVVPALDMTGTGNT